MSADIKRIAVEVRPLLTFRWNTAGVDGDSRICFMFGNVWLKVLESGWFVCEVDERRAAFEH